MALIEHNENLDELNERVDNLFVKKKKITKKELAELIEEHKQVFKNKAKTEENEQLRYKYRGWYYGMVRASLLVDMLED